MRWLQRAGGMLGVLFVVVAVWGRMVGVPRGVKDLLMQEFALRGLHVDMGKVTMDPWGGLVARDLVVYRDGRRKIEQLRLGRVELNLNWLGWREGEPMISGAQLRDADVAWPLGEGVEMTARRVDGWGAAWGEGSFDAGVRIARTASGYGQGNDGSLGRVGGEGSGGLSGWA